MEIVSASRLLQKPASAEPAKPQQTDPVKPETSGEDDAVVLKISKPDAPAATTPGPNEKANSRAKQAFELRDERGREVGKVSTKVARNDEGKVLRSIETVRKNEFDASGNISKARQLSVVRDGGGKVLESRELTVSEGQAIRIKRDAEGEVISTKERKIKPIPRERPEELAPNPRGPVLKEASVLKRLSLKV